MTDPDGNRYRCSWIEDGLSIQSDGNVTCGLDDPHSRRSFGNINKQSVAEIWSNPEYQNLQRRLWEGRRCTECNLAQRVEDAGAPYPTARPARPTTLVVETTVRCNLRCDQPACKPNNDRSIKTRDADFLDLSSFARVMDDLSGSLRHVFFFNYGDPFVNVQAADMLAEIQRTNPTAHVNTTTNGIPLSNRDRAHKVIAAGALDFMQFTISGVNQEAYRRYHVGGRLDLAMLGMSNVLQARRDLGMATPRVQWRYLVFHWNDSEAEIEEALRLAEEYGVDEFRLHLTHVPLEATSWRFSPGGPLFARYRDHIDNALGYTSHSPVPDENGFYHLEQTIQGPVRWSGWRATKSVRVRQGKARIAFATNRPGSDARRDHIFVVTPYETLKVPLEMNVWHSVELTVPVGESLDILTADIVTFDHWYPAEECASSDVRCLGALVLENDEDAEGLPVWTSIGEVTDGDRSRLASLDTAPIRPLID